MTINYQLGKIYKLIDKYDNECIPYYGSTTQKYLSCRLSQHVRNYRRYINNKTNLTTSYNLFKKYDIENIIIILVENYPCNSKNELEMKERFYIENNICVNKQIPTRTLKEYAIDNKEKIQNYQKDYRELNKDLRNKNKKDYYKKNKKKLLEYRKLYHLKNYEKQKEKLIDNQKLYRLNNKDKIFEKRSKKFNCDCGGKYTNGSKINHLKTNKHKKYLNQN